MHLSGETDGPDLSRIDPFKQLAQAGGRLIVPVLRILFGPAGLGKAKGIRPGNDARYISGTVHHQKFDGGCPKVNADIIHQVHLRSSECHAPCCVISLVFCQPDQITFESDIFNYILSGRQR